MRKLYIMLLLALTGSLSACNESNKTVEIKPVPASDDLSAFFEKYLPAISGTHPGYFFIGDNDDRCLMINSIKELEDICSSSVELPAINFNKYTLIVGRHQMATPGYRLLEQSIQVGSGKTELNLILEIPNASLQVVCPIYYGGLYPKLSQTSVQVNFKFRQCQSDLLNQ